MPKFNTKVLKDIELSGKSCIRLSDMTIDNKKDKYLDIRKMYLNSDKEWSPTSKGIAIPYEIIPEILSQIIGNIPYENLLDLSILVNQLMNIEESEESEMTRDEMLAELEESLPKNQVKRKSKARITSLGEISDNFFKQNMDIENLEDIEWNEIKL